MPRTLSHRSRAQLDLFQPPSPRPTWRTMPPAVTQRVRHLLARLLQVHHAGHLEKREGKGVSDE